MQIDFKTEHIEIKVELSVYNLDVLHKCFYWYGENFSVEINVEEGDVGVVRLFPKGNSPETDDKEVLTDKVRNDLIDFKTRDIVTKETKNIRDLLAAKAFAHSDKFDEQPPGNMNHP